jgi:hypothetical protein
MTRALVMMGLFLMSLGVCRGVVANGDPVPTAAPPPPTHFERFVRSGCSPCVQETQSVKSVAIAPAKLPAGSYGLPAAADLPARSGQITLEIMRAWELGRPTRELLAVRVNLLIGMGTATTQPFPLGFGMLDADDASDLARAVGEMAKFAAVPPKDTSIETIDVDYRVGSLRVGVIRLRGDAVAYVQVGDIALLAQRPVWQVPTTVFVSLADLPALATALTEVVIRLRTLRRA